MVRKILYAFKNKRYLEKAKYCINMGIAFMLNFCFRWKPKGIASVWLIGTGDDKYENNCKAFFQYLKENTSETVFWVADKKNIARRFAQIDAEVIPRGSIRNYLLAIHAAAAVYSHSDRDVAPGIYRKFHKHTIIVNINHGQEGIKYIPPNYFKRIPADIICAVSDYEKQIKIKKCGANSEAVKVTGQARCDYFKQQEMHADIKNILIMPTWRDFYLNGKYNFKETPMYRKYKELLENDKFVSLVTEKNIKVTFVFHSCFEEYYKKSIFEIFKQFSFIHVLSGMDSLQKIITESNMLITDYSSLAWDFMYMRKPVLFFWFDYQEYREKRGLFAEEHTFGHDAVFTAGNLLKRLEGYVNKSLNAGLLGTQYYAYIDKQNSKRIYNEIKKRISKDEIGTN